MPQAASLALVGAIDEIAAPHWDACAGTANPFIRHAFLAALERSGSATGETGWLPRHLILKDQTGEIVAAAPLYVKSHSYGEYVFDWAWADALHRAGGRYYPKLQCAVPFTPVTGPRLLARPGPDQDSLRLTLAGEMVALADRAAVSSLHITFPTAAEAALAGADGDWLPRLGCQYHWTNRGYDRFDDFLGELAARKRKQVRKERQAVAAQDLTLVTLVGDDVKPRHWDAFHRFYSATVDRKWGSAYLTRAFFDQLSQSELGSQVVLIWAERDGQPLAAAFNMMGGDTLFGRLWGAGAEVPFLHFEACYYRALDFAISHRLARVEAGAQGEHKVARGYLPAATHSLHWIKDPSLRGGVARFLAHERTQLTQAMAQADAAGPFRQEEPTA